MMNTIWYRSGVSVILRSGTSAKTYLLTGKHGFSQQFISGYSSVVHEVLVTAASDTELVTAKVHYFIKDGEALVSRSEATAL